MPRLSKSGAAWGLLAALLLGSISGSVSAVAAGLNQIDREALLPFPANAVWSGIINFRPGTNENVTLNPPRFSWYYTPDPANNNTDSLVREFQFQCAYDPGFATLVVNVRTDVNFYNFLAPFTNSPVYWRVGYINAETGATNVWSQTRSFTIAAGAVTWDRSRLADTNYVAQRGQHPHMFFNATNRAAVASWVTNNNLPDWVKLTTDASTAVRSAWWTNVAANDLAAYEIMKVAFIWQMTHDPYLTGPSVDVAAALERVALWYTAEGKWRQDFVFGGVNARVSRSLGLGYDWLYEIMTPTQRANVLAAIRLGCQFWGKAYWWTYPKVDALGNGDPTGNYAGGAIVNRWKGFLMGSSHGYVNALDQMTAAFAAYPEDPDVRQFMIRWLHYLIGKTVWAGGEEGYNQGRLYNSDNLFKSYPGSLGALHHTIEAQTIFPEIQFNKNPFWHTNADWMARMYPLGLTATHQPWGDTGFGDIRIWQDRSIGRNLALFTGNGTVQKLHQNEIALRASVGFTTDSQTLEELLVSFHFQTPAVPTNTMSLARAFPTEGWVFGSSQPPDTTDCFTNGVGFIFQARPRGTENGHSHNSDLSFEMWAYGAGITEASGAYTRYGKLPHSHYSLFIDGMGRYQPPYPHEPYYGRIVAFTNASDYVFCGAEATAGYPRRAFEPGGDLQTVPYCYDMAKGPLYYVKKVQRHILFPRRKYFVIVDTLETDKPARFQWVYQVPDLYTNRGGVLRADLRAGTRAQDMLTLNTNTVRFGYRVSNVGPNNFYQTTTAQVDVQVAHVCGLSDLQVWDMVGTNARSNPITGDNYWNLDNDSLDPFPRRHTIWVGNRTPATNWCFVTVIYPVRAGEPAPLIVPRNNYSVGVTNGAEGDLITFDPGSVPGANYSVNLAGMGLGAVIGQVTATNSVPSGQTQVPPATFVSPALAANNILDAVGLATKLRNHADPVSQFVWSQCAAEAQQVVGNQNSTLDQLLPVLVSELRRICQTSSIYDAQRFAGVTLSAATSDLLQQNPTGARLMYLNQLLLMDAYPAELRKWQ